MKEYIRENEKWEKLKGISEKFDLQIITASQIPNTMSKSNDNEKGIPEKDVVFIDYVSLLSMNNMVQNDTWQLFFDMQCYNPYTPLMRLTLRQSLDNLEEKIRVESETKAPDDGTFFLWRSMIEQLDHEIIQLIAHRLNVGKRVQEYKKMRDLPVTDPEREKELDKNYEIWMRELGISAVEPVKNVLKLLMKEVKSQNLK